MRLSMLFLSGSGTATDLLMQSLCQTITIILWQAILNVAPNPCNLFPHADL